MGMAFKKIFPSRVASTVCLMFTFNVIFSNASGKPFNSHFFKAVTVNCEEFKRAVTGSKCASNGQSLTSPMTPDIGARRPAGINVPTTGNAAMFERLKTTSRCNFNVIIELFDSGILHSSGSTSRLPLAKNARLPETSSAKLGISLRSWTRRFIMGSIREMED